MARSHRGGRAAARVGAALAVLLALAGGVEARTEPTPTLTVDRTDPLLREVDGTLYRAGRPLTGTVVERYDGGAVRRTTSYLRGLREGKDRRWYPSGRAEEERSFSRGREEGRHRGWWEDGRPRFDFTYRDGRMEGEALEWLPDGTLHRRFHYRAGHEEGSQQMWWPDGRLRASYVVRDGRRYGLMGAKGCVSNDSTAARR